jgi:hypothetical protein
MFKHRSGLIALRTLPAVSCLIALAGCGGAVPVTATGVSPATTPSSTSSGSSSSTGSPSSPTGTSQPPAAPTGLVATPGTAQVSLAWTASPNASSYSVTRATASSGPFGEIATTATTSYVDSTVTGGATYFYAVSAVNGQGASTASAPVSATVAAAAPPPPPPPPPPPVTVTPVTSLPAVAAMSNVRVTTNGGSATITFDPVDGAVDYRVFALPANDNIQLASDGTVIVPNAVYRCAGLLHAPSAQSEDQFIPNDGVTTRVASSVNGYTRKLADATLGYVYATADAAPDLTPVYVVAAPNVSSDNQYFYRFQASREKKYTTSATEYGNLVAAGWRDDGIAFYVPKTASTATRAVYANANPDSVNGDARYVLIQGPEMSSRSSSLGFAPIFNVLTSAATGSKPLMRVFYQNCCGGSHDELAVGQAAFTRIRYQGVNAPVTTVHFSGVTATTTLVVEALDRGCPFQGHLAAKSLPAQTPSGIAHPAWLTLSDLQSTVDQGEVFVNGQHDGVVGRPKAIARAFVNVSPKPQAMDWTSSPASFSEPFTTIACGSPDGNCFQTFRQQSNSYDLTFHYAETDHWTGGNVLGQFLINYADWAADTNGKVRMTVRKAKGNIASGSFMHATMEVNSVSSARRYPQLIVSDQDAPVQYNLIHGRSLLLQVFQDYPAQVDLEICDHVDWDVNLQCPRFIFRQRLNSSGAVTGINPMPEADSFLAAVDAPTKFDLYVSTTRAYILVNDKPYACANLTNIAGLSPAPVAPAGPVTVTFGDALYHSGADDNFLTKVAGSFISKHYQIESTRHFDNLGFSSGVAAPAWDEARIPCSSTMTSQ